jgi:peptidoglycan/LPS O-acetylase OafA/YrhL
MNLSERYGYDTAMVLVGYLAAAAVCGAATIYYFIIGDTRNGFDGVAATCVCIMGFVVIAALSEPPRRVVEKPDLIYPPP